MVRPHVCQALGTHKDRVHTQPDPVYSHCCLALVVLLREQRPQV